VIQVLQYRGVSWLSKAIKLFTWGDYSHTALLNTETGEIIEAWHPGGVRLVTLEKHQHTPGTVVDVYDILPTLNHPALWEDLKAEIGRGYDFGGIFGFMARVHSEKEVKWFCSELAARKLARAGVLMLNAPSWKISPSLLAYSPLMKYNRTLTLR
jgi:uncharacterized protein YycO